MSQFTAISPQLFAGKAWLRNITYTFAAQSNVLPVVAAELAKVIPFMPLGFVQTEKTFQLVAITSLEPGTNFFVSPDGKWIGNYVPAALRAYPFRLIKPQDREDTLLCIDESSGLVAEAGSGEAFFDEAGELSSALGEVLDFLAVTERNRVMTQAAVDALQSAALLQPWSLSVRQGDRTLPMNGLYRVDETALNAADGDTLVALRDKGALVVAYAQLFSMSQLDVLEKRKVAQAQLQMQAASNAIGLTIPDGLSFPQDNGTIRFS